MSSISLPGSIVSGEWLVDHLDEVDVADVRWSLADGPKHGSFLDGRLPGAVFIDLDNDLSDPPGSRGRHPLPPVDRFRTTLRRLGLGGRPIVCYDDASGSTAARMWWMLQAVGVDAAVLDGGIGAWPGALESGDARPPSVDTGFDGPDEDRSTGGGRWPADQLVEVEDVLARIDGGAVLLDARSAERFAGELNAVDPVAGHIPGARSRPWTDNIGPDGRFRSPAELAADFARLGVGDAIEQGRGWIASCGSGVTACHNLLAARIAGLSDGRLYAGSWSEWIQDPQRPVVADGG